MPLCKRAYIGVYIYMLGGNKLRAQHIAVIVRVRAASGGETMQRNPARETVKLSCGYSNNNSVLERVPGNFWFERNYTYKMAYKKALVASGAVAYPNRVEKVWYPLY